MEREIRLRRCPVPNREYDCWRCPSAAAGSRVRDTQPAASPASQDWGGGIGRVIAASLMMGNLGSWEEEERDDTMSIVSLEVRAVSILDSASSGTVLKRKLWMWVGSDLLPGLLISEDKAKENFAIRDTLVSLMSFVSGASLPEKPDKRNLFLEPELDVEHGSLRLLQVGPAGLRRYRSTKEVTLSAVDLNNRIPLSNPSNRVPTK